MEVNDPDFALESATHAQPQARELCKIAALNANFLPNAPVSELIGKSSHVKAPRESQCGALSHEQSYSDESPEDLEKSTEWIFLYRTFSSVSCPFQVQQYSKLLRPPGPGRFFVPVPSPARAHSAQWLIPIWAAVAEYFHFEVLNSGAGELLPARTGLPNAPASSEFINV